MLPLDIYLIAYPVTMMPSLSWYFPQQVNPIETAVATQFSVSGFGQT